MTFLRRLNHVVWIWFYLAVLFLISILLGADLEGMVITFSIFSPFWIPAIITHFLYVREEMNKSVEILNGRLIVRKNGNVKEIPFNDIEKVSLFIHGFNSGKMIPFLTPLDTYYFFKVFLKSEEQFQFTCLLMDNYKDFGNFFWGIELEKRRGFGVLFSFSVN